MRRWNSYFLPAVSFFGARDPLSFFTVTASASMLCDIEFGPGQIAWLNYGHTIARRSTTVRSLA